MSIESFIKAETEKLGDKVYISPTIPDKKMDGAISGISPNVDPNFVLAIIDTSIFGSAKEGCLFTGEYLYVHALAREKIKIQLSEIENIEYSVKEQTKKNGKLEKIKSLILKMKDHTKVDLSNDLNGINIRVLSDLLAEVVKMGLENNEFVSTSQILPLSMMDVEVKKSYIKLICNFAFSDDENIDAKEYAEITSLLVRIELDSKNRLEIRRYMTNYENILSNKELLLKIRNHLKAEDYDMIKKSIMKDILFINRIKKNDWKENEFILEMIEMLDIEKEQVEFMNEAIISDEEILNQRKNDSEITKSMKDIASKAAAVGVPLAAIYLSGSVVGVSAAGITSGLAALGMKGALGFSPMFAGIGVAVLVGVGTYKGLKKITGISDLENNKQRELMLQQIIRNAQESLNYLIEDINEITRQLIEEISKGLNTRSKINELTLLLERISRGAQVTSDKSSYAERESIIAHLPLELNVARLEELTDSATKLKIREIVMSYYIKTTKEIEDGTIKEIYILNDEISINDLTNLNHIIEDIGYNKVGQASIASVKGVTKRLFNSVKG